MKTPKNEQEKPLVVLVHDPSLLGLWMENSLSQLFRVCVFSTSGDALTFAGSTFVFSDTSIQDHRLLILKNMDRIRFMSKPFDAFFITRRVRDALNETPGVE